MGGRIRFGSAGLARDASRTATDKLAGRGIHATMPGIGRVAACAMQLHMQAPGGQQSACDAEGAAGASCVAVASWHGGAACCVLVATSLKAMRAFANAVVVP